MRLLLAVARYCWPEMRVGALVGLIQALTQASRSRTVSVCAE